MESLQLARLHGHGDGETARRSAAAQAGLFSCRHAAVRTLSQGCRVSWRGLHLDATPRLWVLDGPFDALDTGDGRGSTPSVGDWPARRRWRC